MPGTFASTDYLLIIGLPLAVILLGILFGVVIPRMRRRRQRQHGITLAAFSDTGIVVPQRPTRPPTPESTPSLESRPRTPASQVAQRPVVEAPQSTFAPPTAREATGTLGADWGPPVPAPPADVPRLRLETQLERPAHQPTHAAEKVLAGAEHQPVPAEKPPLRVHRPLDGTLQFLPGRLEIVEGRDLGQEIRFVRQPGPGPTVITFGRQDGSPYKHIQLHEPTVSRIHARMSHEEHDWRLTNLSRTNPISVNGASMAPENTTVILKDGDRIEMGEVVFRFRAK